MSYDGITAQYCCSGIYNNIVFNVRMPFDSFDQVSLFVNGKTFSTKGYPLVNLYIIPYYTCFPDNNTRAMVNEEYSPIEAPG